MAIEGENLGVATIYLTVDKTSMDATIGKAKLQLAGMGAEASKQYDAMSVSQQKMAQGLVKQADLINKTTAERIAYNAQLKIGGALGDEIAAKALANAQAVTGAQVEATDAAKAAAAVQAEMAAAEDARFKKIASDAIAEVEARQAITAATMEQARANAALAEASGAGAAGGASQAIGALDSATVERQIADYAALDAIMGKKVATTEEVAAAEAALDRLQAEGMLSNEELAASFEALNVVTAAETKSLQANSVAQVENAAATKINSRTQYELGIMLGEVASGNINRLKRSGAALANSTGLLRAIMTPTGLAITGVVAALGAFGIAALKGEEESSKFNNALIMTGGYAGKTAAQLQDMAKQMDSLPDVTEHAAEAVLAAVVATGKFSGEAVPKVAQAALELQQTTGQAVDKTIANFEKLGKDPVKGILDLNDSMHFLTQATYDQITALIQQGDKDKAAQVAQDAYAEAVKSRTADVADNLGTLQKAWHGIAGVAKEAWDAMLNVGRPESVDEKIAAVQQKLAAAREQLVTGQRGTIGLTSSQINQGLQAQQIDFDAVGKQVLTLENQLKSLQFEKLTGGNVYAAGQSLANKLITDRINAQQELSKYAAPDKMLQAQLNAAAETRAKALIGVVDPAKRSEIKAEYDRQVAELKEHAAHASKGHAPKNNPAATALATFQSQVDGLTNKSIGVPGDPNLTKYVQGVAKLNDEFDKAIGKHADLTKAQAVYDEGMKALNATLAKNQAAQAADQQALRDASDAKVAAYKAQIALQVEAVGMGDKEIQRAQQLAQLRSQYADQIERLQERAARNPDQKDAISVQIANTKREMDAMVQATEQGYDQMDAAQGNWANGAAKAIKNFHDQTADVATQTAGIFNTAFSDMTNALVTFVTTGKLSFKSLVTDVLKGIAEMEIKAAESKLFDFVGQLISSYFGGGTTIDSNAIAAGNYTGPHAMGGVFPGPIAAFAGGGIVNSPTLFKFANGTGLMGEAGPEAIMPLSRGSDGKLGVKAAGGGNIININTQVTVDQNGARSKTTSDSSDAAARQLGSMMEAKAKEVVGRAIQPGGILWRHGVGQAA